MTTPNRILLDPVICHGKQSTSAAPPSRTRRRPPAAMGGLTPAASPPDSRSPAWPCRFGEREVIHEQVSRSRRPSEWMSTQTTSEHRVLEAAVLASEIEQLADLQGYLKFASTPHWRRVGLVAG